MSNLHDSAAEKIGGLSPEKSLDELLNRSQSDFELEFYSSIAAVSPCYVDVLVQLAQLLTQKNRHPEALEVDRRLALLRPEEPLVFYNLACSFCLLGRTHESMEALRRAIQFGYWDIDHLLVDPDLSGLHDTPEFQSLMDDFDFLDV